MKKIVVAILMLESRLILRKYKPFIVAVTGSVGKTSTKDAIYEALSKSSRFKLIRKSEKSLNSELGLPLTVIGVPNAWHSLSGWWSNISAGANLIFRRSEYPDCLILEIGADHPGDIRRVARWVRPDIAVLTKISRTPVHVEFFASPEQVFAEKAFLAEAVKPGGTLVAFADDAEMAAKLSDCVKGKDVSVVSFGLDETALVKGSDIQVIYDTEMPIGLSFGLELDHATTRVSVHGILGQSYVYSLLAAAAVGRACGMPAGDIAAALSAYQAPHGRLTIIPGMNESTLIDDSYNSSPDAVSAALGALQSLSGSGRKIAILGDMMELGSYASDAHRQAGREAAGIVSELITVGQRSRLTAEEAVKSGLPAEHVCSFDSATEAAADAARMVGAGDIILVKGSQSMRMERVSAALLQEPEKAATLLVRQEKEWLEKA